MQSIGEKGIDIYLVILDTLIFAHTTITSDMSKYHCNYLTHITIRSYMSKYFWKKIIISVC